MLLLFFPRFSRFHCSGRVRANYWTPIMLKKISFYSQPSHQWLSARFHCMFTLQLQEKHHRPRGIGALKDAQVEKQTSSERMKDAVVLQERVAQRGLKLSCCSPFCCTTSRNHKHAVNKAGGVGKWHHTWENLWTVYGAPTQRPITGCTTHGRTMEREQCSGLWPVFTDILSPSL